MHDRYGGECVAAVMVYETKRWTPLTVRQVKHPLAHLRIFSDAVVELPEPNQFRFVHFTAPKALRALKGSVAHSAHT